MPLADLTVIAEDEASHNPLGEISLNIFDRPNESRINAGDSRVKKIRPRARFRAQIRDHPQIPHNSHTVSTVGSSGFLGVGAKALQRNVSRTNS